MKEKLTFHSCYKSQGYFCPQCDEMLWQTVGTILVVAETGSFYVSKPDNESCPFCGFTPSWPRPERFDSEGELMNRLLALKQMPVERVFADIPLMSADSLLRGSVN